MGNLQVESCAVGLLQTNCYLLINRTTRETLIVDPGAEAELIQEKCINVTPVAILLTHGHFDHVMAADTLRKRYNIPVLAGENEPVILSSPEMNCGFMIRKAVSLTADRLLADCEQLDLAQFSIAVIAAPGHTIGGVCYYIENEKALISGDTLLFESFGRYDFPTGSLPALAGSIKNKLFSLPEDTAVYPGHGAATTIAHEKLSNAILSYYA